MFEDSTFESQGRIHTRSKRWMIAALGFNGSILAALVLIPLIYPSMLPVQPMPYLISALQPPTAAPMIHRAPTPASATSSPNILDPFQAPRQIPPSIFIASSPEPDGRIDMPGADSGPGSGVPGGVGDDTFHHATPNVVHPEEKTIRVTSSMEEGMNIFRTIPTYPVIARSMRVEGTVVLAATISKAGTIENLRVASGSPVLQQAALDAVKTWRYKPYILDGQPVEVETSIEVVFRIQH
jgi:periplasmic protein TonB